MSLVPGLIAALLGCLLGKDKRHRPENPGQANGELQHTASSPAPSHPDQMPLELSSLIMPTSAQDPSPSLSREELRLVVGQANAALQHIQPPSSTPSHPDQMPLEPASSVAPTSAQKPSRSVTREELQSMVDQLATAVQQHDANLLMPLKNALIGLVDTGDIIVETIVPGNMLVAFKSRVAVFVVVAAPTTSNYAAASALLSYYRSLSEIIERIWKILQDADAVPTPQNTQDAKLMLETLTTMLEVFEFDDQVDADKKFSIVCQRLYSGNGIISDEIRSMGVINNNSNTNYSFNGGHIYNYNPVNNFIFSRGVTEQRDEAMPKIMAVLGDQIARDAPHYAQLRTAGCLEHTRKSVMSKLMRWVMVRELNIFWLAGMAGTGKTSIAVTISRMLQNDPSVILGVPTLAASLAAHAPDFATALASELKDSVHVVARYPATVQITAFLEKPLAALSSSSRPIVFIIDALDECDEEKETADLLGAIVDFKSAANVKFILLSRPEVQIRGTRISSPDYSTILKLHEINDKEVSGDIRWYITSTLQRKTREAGWYSGTDIETLVDLSQGLFIFASTVLAYILSREEVGDRQDRLRKATSAASGGSKVQMASLYEVYRLIVREAWRDDIFEEDELNKTRRVIACILAARTPLSVEALAELLGLSSGMLRGALERLHSVVYIPPVGSAGLRTLHASFGEYMYNTATADVRIAASLGDEELAHGCLHMMAESLRRRPAGSGNSHQSNGVNHWDNITLSLEYACQQWIHHVHKLSDRSAFETEIANVSSLQKSFWLDVVSGSTSIGRAAALLLGGPV